jgi:sialic acid synthase SpsE
MATLRRRFNVPVGFSDHSTGIAVAVASAALGAAVIEKHLTLDRSMPGPDHAASLEPDEFAQMVRGIHEAYDALGDGKKVPRLVEDDVRIVSRRSIVAARELPMGHVLSFADLTALRPGSGISPLRIDALVGRRLTKSMMEGEMITTQSVTPRLE